MKPKLKFLLFFLLAFVININLFAMTDSSEPYQVELIMFAYPATDNHEVFPSYIESPEVSHLTALCSPEPGEEIIESYCQLPESKLSLTSTYQKIDNVASPLGYFGWQQPTNNEHKVLIGQQDGDERNLSGWVKVTSGKYYTLSFHLNYLNQALSSTEISIKGQRKLKDGEVHYIDHPQIGIIAMVKPVTG